MAEKTFSQRYAAAWAAMHNPPQDSVNPHFNNRFASLAATLQVVRDACAAQGLAYRQTVECGEERSMLLRTCVTDGETGEELALSTFPLTYNANPQQMGSQLTYAKRQAAQADWAIVGEADDDAEAAAKGAAQRPQERPRAPKAKERDYSGLRAECERLAASHGTTVRDEWDWVCQTYGNPKAKTDEEYEQLLGILRMMEA